MQVKVEVTIQGISPLLMHRYFAEPVKALDKKPPEEQAEYAAYRIPNDGNLYIPGDAIRSSLVGGAKYVKGKGRASLQGPVGASVTVTPEYVDLGVTEYVIDARPVVNQNTRNRIMCYRPKLETWSATFTIEYDNDLITQGQLREVVDNAGKLAGLLAYRPGNRGPFGRYIATRWEAI